MKAYLIAKGKTLRYGEEVKGFYWYIEEHLDPKLSKRHFIKSINNGNDYEVNPDTVEVVRVRFTEKIDKVMSQGIMKGEEK